MYGQYLHDGLGAMPGARYAGESLRIPKPTPITGTAQGGTLTALYGLSPRIPPLVFGRTPTWEVEGHQVDPFYDVRGNSGLGQVGSQGPGTPMDYFKRPQGTKLQSSPASSSSEAPALEAPAGMLERLGNPLLLAAAIAGVYFFLLRRK